MTRLFGTDGVRGIANQEPMTPETVVKLGEPWPTSSKPRVPGEAS